MPAAMVVAVAAMVGTVETILVLLDVLGKRRFRSLFFKLRAALRRQISEAKGRKQRSSFHYDPLSYALNFDDGTTAAFLFSLT